MTESLGEEDGSEDGGENEEIEESDNGMTEDIADAYEQFLAEQSKNGGKWIFRSSRSERSQIKFWTFFSNELLLDFEAIILIIVTYMHYSQSNAAKKIPQSRFIDPWDLSHSYFYIHAMKYVEKHTL